MQPWFLDPSLSKKHQNLVRQDSKNGLFSYHWGYEIDPYCSNGSVIESESSKSAEHGGGEDGTL
jgi:hypothetical protein